MRREIDGGREGDKTEKGRREMECGRKMEGKREEGGTTR